MISALRAFRVSMVLLKIDFSSTGLREATAVVESPRAKTKGARR
jgi:hypothetical protein